AKYDLHRSWHKKWCFKVMADLWRASKSRLMTDLINATTESERLALKPDCIKSDVEWRSFIKLKTSKEHLVLRSIFQERRKKKAPITLSQRGYARTIDDMAKEGGDPINRIHAFRRAHTKKNGEPINQEATEIFGVKPASEAQSHTIPSPKSVGHKFSEVRSACYLLDWSGEIVAEGHWSSSDPNIMVHGIPLRAKFMRVWVEVAKAPSAYLFRPNHEMLTMGEAVGSTVAWPAEKVIAR
ncbi:hypothetical protein UlMin_015905, partial [Ulmus minor]